MFLFYIFLSLTLSFETFNGYTLVPIGDYPDYLIHGINLPECGLRFVPTVHNISLDKNCVKNIVFSKTVYDIEGNDYMFGMGQTQQRVFKGTQVAWAEAPWTVLIISELHPFKYVYSFCTGSLITFEWVLTAAHCAKGWFGITESVKVVKIIAGSNVRGQGEYHYKAKWFPHESYVDPSNLSERKDWQQIIKSQFDIGLIKLGKPFTRHKNDGRHYSINTVCLPQPDISLYAPGPATFFGYGAKENWSKVFSIHNTYLLKGDVNLSTWFDCHTLYYCTKYKPGVGGRPCPGDSGGPLVRYSDRFYTRAVQIGVLGGVRPLKAWYDFRVCVEAQIEEADWPPVPLHIDWILKTIKEN